MQGESAGSRLPRIEVSEAVKAGHPGHGVGAWLLELGPLDVVERLAKHEQNAYLTDPAVRNRLATAVEQWKIVFKSMGAKSGERSSIDNLARGVERNNGFRDWGPFVNYYNALSLVLATPFGAYDVAKIAGPMRLALGESSLSFTPLGKPDKKEKTKPAEVYYRDDERVICRMWNLADCDETKVTPQTNQIILIADLMGTKDETMPIFNEITCGLSTCGQLVGSAVEHW